MSPQAAEEAAKESMKGQAAPHNPDGIAGGKVDQITGNGRWPSKFIHWW